jgi:hypothetical protein
MPTVTPAVTYNRKITFPNHIYIYIYIYIYVCVRVCGERMFKKEKKEVDELKISPARPTH